MKKGKITVLSAFLAISLIGCAFGVSKTAQTNSHTSSVSAQAQETSTNGLTRIKLDDFSVKTITGEEFKPARF